MSLCLAGCQIYHVQSLDLGDFPRKFLTIDFNESITFVVSRTEQEFLFKIFCTSIYIKHFSILTFFLLFDYLSNKFVLEPKN